MSDFVSDLDHVQLAMPRGDEARARTFYRDLLGMTEIEKPASLQANGGCWFVARSARLHLGVEDEFQPARKAHPALRVNGYEVLRARLAEAGHATKADDRLSGIDRCYVDDPFGNRIELIRASAPDMHEPDRTG